MRIVCLAGDGIGPEVMREALRALEILLPEAEIVEMPFGHEPLEREGTPLPEATMRAVAEADAVLLGAVGSGNQQWQDGGNAEDGLFQLRRMLDVFANLRPVKWGDLDVLLVRELVGGIYFGPRGKRPDGTVFDTCEYKPAEVERVARKAFEIARSRRKRLTSVDKANVLATSRLWRGVVAELAEEYPDVTVDHLLVDTAVLHVGSDPRPFDVILTDNMFGDILSDALAVHGGGLGVLPSASIGNGAPGLFEPVHGSAPDLVGTGHANPAGMLLSVALMLRWGLERPELADALEDAVAAAIANVPTRDLGGTAAPPQFGDAVVERLAAYVSEGRQTKASETVKSEDPA